MAKTEINIKDILIGWLIGFISGVVFCLFSYLGGYTGAN